MKKIGAFILSMCILPFGVDAQNYDDYHQQVIDAETWIAAENYEAALNTYEVLFETYGYIFLRDYQVAVQLAFKLGEREKGIRYLKESIRCGWKIKSIKKNQFLINQLKKEEWKSIKEEYSGLRAQYDANLNLELRAQVKMLFKKDQWKALGALFKIGDQQKTKYAEERFAPHSEEQMVLLDSIYRKHDYPGERIIGNNYWVSTILSHHNSISKEYNTKDEWYPKLKPRLRASVIKGNMSPYEYALIDEWHRLSKDEISRIIYGIIDTPKKEDLELTNQLRAEIFMRTVRLRNKLIEVEDKTKMNFYLEETAWIKGILVFN